MNTLNRLIVLLLLAGILAAPAAAEDENYRYSQAELDQLLAPIALYPDTLLAQILTASTYPFEIVQAARWSRARPHLDGEAAIEAAADQDWSPSVQALVAFPDVIDRMDRDLDWTTQLGEAFLFQEGAVMATVQSLRERAYRAGNLESPGNLRVHREPEVIIIEPVQPRVVYVPYYDPWTVYGHWWRPSHPPYYWSPPPGYYSRAAFYWGSGISFSFGYYYSSFDWHRRHTVVHVHKHAPRPYYQPAKRRYNYAGYSKWQHDPKRRQYRSGASRHAAPQRSERRREGQRHESSGAPFATRPSPDRRQMERRQAERSGTADKPGSARRLTNTRVYVPPDRSAGRSGSSTGDAVRRSARQQEAGRQTDNNNRRLFSQSAARERQSSRSESRRTAPQPRSERRDYQRRSTDDGGVAAGRWHGRNATIGSRESRSGTGFNRSSRSRSESTAPRAPSRASSGATGSSRAFGTRNPGSTRGSGNRPSSRSHSFGR